MSAIAQPERSDPDRFSDERKEDIGLQRNFLSFGCGPHYYVGREYATNHLIVYLAILLTRYCDTSAMVSCFFEGRLSASVLIRRKLAALGLGPATHKRFVCSAVATGPEGGHSYLPTIYPHDSLITLQEVRSPEDAEGRPRPYFYCVVGCAKFSDQVADDDALT